MDKYRIVTTTLTGRFNSDTSNKYIYKIQKLKFGWRDVYNSNGSIETLLEFDSYKKAERYLIDKLNPNSIIENKNSIYYCKPIICYY
jgi:hypothetical protein